MEIRTLKATEIKAADYNPRKDLEGAEKVDFCLIKILYRYFAN